MQSEVKIPKKMSHIWIGPRPAPADWMKTWRDHHPDWEYTLFDNDYLAMRKFRTQAQINEYLKRGKYAGVADLMRLEILLEQGGFMPGADSICLRNMDHLFSEECAYTVYENELVRGRLVSPIQAAEPGNPFVERLIQALCRVDPADLEDPWVSTGNLFLAKKIEEISPKIIIFPSHFTIPLHYSGVCYEGGGDVYALQMFGSTNTGIRRGRYDVAPFFSRVAGLYSRVSQFRYNRKRLSAARARRIKEAEERLGVKLT